MSRLEMMTRALLAQCSHAWDITTMDSGFGEGDIPFT